MSRGGTPVEGKAIVTLGERGVQSMGCGKLWVSSESCASLERGVASCYFGWIARSGGTGRRAGLKIQWYLVPCGFDPLLRDQTYTKFLDDAALEREARGQNRRVRHPPDAVIII